MLSNAGEPSGSGRYDAGSLPATIPENQNVSWRFAVVHLALPPDVQRSPHAYATKERVGGLPGTNRASAAGFDSFRRRTQGLVYVGCGHRGQAISGKSDFPAALDLEACLPVARRAWLQASGDCANHALFGKYLQRIAAQSALAPACDLVAELRGPGICSWADCQALLGAVFCAGGRGERNEQASPTGRKSPGVFSLRGMFLQSLHLGEQASGPRNALPSLTSHITHGVSHEAYWCDSMCRFVVQLDRRRFHPRPESCLPSATHAASPAQAIASSSRKPGPRQNIRG